MITKTVGNMCTFANYALNSLCSFLIKCFALNSLVSLLDLIHKDKYLEWVLLSDEGATFQMSGHVNCHNVQMWGIKNLHMAC
jgi:hypothetical protein